MAAAQVSPVALGGILIALQELKYSLESTVNTVDAESAARINQLSIAVDSAIKEVQGAIDDASKQVQFNKNKVFSDVFTVMSSVNSELTNKGYLAYIGANASLANVATTLSGIPFVKVPAFLFATYPLRLSSKATDTMISIYGHFPDIDDSHPATATYKMDGVGEQTVTLKPYVGGSLGFQLPPTYLKESRFVEVTISIPKTEFYFFTGHSTFYTRVYVETLKAFSVAISEFEANPNLWQKHCLSNRARREG